MVPSIKNIFKLIIILSFALMLTGCYNRATEELFSLPQASEEYLKLQEKINTILAADAEYAAPVSGSNRQSVQLQDLNNDGMDEAIAFFSVAGDKPMKIYIFKSNEGTYEEATVINGEGTAIDSISYTDMNGDGFMEIVVGWQMSATLKLIQVYSIVDFQSASILSSDYSEYTISDLDLDGNSDVVVLRLLDTSQTGELEMFSLTSDGEVVSEKANLSRGITAVSRVRSSTLFDGSPAIYIESLYAGSSLITDIFVYRYGSLLNITANRITGISEDTVRLYNVYCSDINDDDVLEVPYPRILQSQTDTIYYAIDWYSYNSMRKKVLTETTYHNYYDGWYLILPDDWKENITVRRQDTVYGERAIVFSRALGEDKPVEDFLVIYSLSGENREERAVIDERFVIVAEEETIYAAEILVPLTDFELTINRQLIISNFYIIYSDWITGAT